MREFTELWFGRNAAFNGIIAFLPSLHPIPTPLLKPKKACYAGYTNLCYRVLAGKKPSREKQLWRPRLGEKLNYSSSLNWSNPSATS